MIGALPAEAVDGQVALVGRWARHVVPDAQVDAAALTDSVARVVVGEIQAVGAVVADSECSPGGAHPLGARRLCPALVVGPRAHPPRAQLVDRGPLEALQRCTVVEQQRGDVVCHLGDRENRRRPSDCPVDHKLDAASPVDPQRDPVARGVRSNVSHKLAAFDGRDGAPEREQHPKRHLAVKAQVGRQRKRWDKADDGVFVVGSRMEAHPNPRAVGLDVGRRDEPGAPVAGARSDPSDRETAAGVDVFRRFERDACPNARCHADAAAAEASVAVRSRVAVGARCEDGQLGVGTPPRDGIARPRAVARGGRRAVRVAQTAAQIREDATATVGEERDGGPDARVVHSAVVAVVANGPVL
mmetsp:Transcript_30617/g.80151  ORF Transcript_30617/g.80151 Transcript_30617/m.80151 type:complete len:357 (+) Transcript_30617:2111-3181(+)